ncbi:MULTISPECIES: type II secretion system F family protein [Chloracidobacterium]|jgi:type IV pilus assembly protein PilC|uniref:Type II secretory pathway, component PulF n=1 Tax=Chloracidobacterium thermophilum (strain B) TaxID=981222 RepID=G2LGS9_CHLTF|nr:MULTISPECIES: type II secretion system F family protein [Chloracidobacterium]AEP11190.1 Type II secretory pathway, component PulF [Chloracidobacterium thermophilum B]QUV79101.1 type II secretion system F family protein [Chloracidobacterium thermophilum]QUV82148.1 type II secretion system F family protein [Chloracidobacterium sp. D]
MPEFTCRLGTPSGDIVTRIVEANGIEELRTRLQNEGFRIFAIERPVRRALSRSLFGGVKVKSQEFLLYNQQLATLLRAGLPLLQVLNILIRRQPPGAFRTVLEDVERRITRGALLSEAYGEHPDVFPRLLTASVLAGERSGELDAVLERYVTYAKATAEVRRKLIKTLTYPAVLTVASVALVALLTTYVIPKFATLYESSQSQLPLVTVYVVAVSKAVENNLSWVGPLLLTVALGFFFWRRTDHGREVLDGLLLRLPIIGDIIRQSTTVRFCRSAATLLNGGLPLLESLDIASEVIGNRRIARTMPDVVRGIQEGKTLVEVLEQAGWLPPLATDMIGVGEQSGALVTMLDEVAQFYEAELDVKIASLTALVEPVVLTFMGAIVLIVVMALYLPILNFATGGAVAR